MFRPDPSEVARLLPSGPSSALRPVWLEPGRLTIGRRADNHLVLDDPTVSGRHAVIDTDPAGSVVRDLGSRNGTRVNGEPVVERALRDGDRIEVGDWRLEYVAPGRRAARIRPVDFANSIAPAVPVGPIGPVSPASPVAGLHVLSGAGAGREITLAPRLNRIDDGGRQLAVVAWRDPGWTITHVEGAAAPLVAGAPIGPGPHPLVDGDVIELGTLLLQFSAGGGWSGASAADADADPDAGPDADPDPDPDPDRGPDRGPDLDPDRGPDLDPDSGPNLGPGR